MWTYIIRRLLYTIPVVIGVLLVTFVLFKAVPGDVSSEIAGKSASAETIAELRAEHGWDKPLIVNWDAAKQQGALYLFDSQFFHHFKNALTFNFGRSPHTKQKVSETILRGAGPSLSLTVPMFITLLVVSLSISLMTAYFRGRIWDTLLVFTCVVGMSMPMLAFILFGQFILGYKLGWFPVFGYDTGFGAMKYVVLPALLGVVAGLGSDVRFYRTVMLDEIRSDYIRTAYAKGVSTPRVLFVHLLKNAMIPVLTRVVLAIPFLFLGSLLLERFFGIPGLGYLMIEAINSRDYVVINAMTFLISLLFVLGNLATDICYALVDPRISLS